MNAMSLNSAQDCACGHVEGGAWSIDRALEAAGQMARPVHETQSLPVAQSVGRVLATALRASDPLPRFDHAAMDGYALRRADLVGQGPWHLPVGQRIAAGQAPAPLASRQAARIFTGAPIPAGADAVIMQEQVRVANGLVRIDTLPDDGAHIRRRGEEIAIGDELLPAGRRLTARDLAVAACAGFAHLTVLRPVRVALLTTGDELCQPGEPPAPGRTADVNGPMLIAALTRPDVIILDPRHVADTAEDHRAALKAAAAMADLIVTTGGVSVGEEDHMRAAVQALGGQIEVPAVAIKPGKPVTLGRLDNALWLGLPGNPMSAFVTFMLFGLPLLSGLTGSTGKPNSRQGIAANEIIRHPGRCEIRPACIDGHDENGSLRLTIGGTVHSGRMTPLARADGCVVIPAQAARIGQGDLLDFMPFPEGI